jgi:hypothetical protein
MRPTSTPTIKSRVREAALGKQVAEAWILRESLRNSFCEVIHLKDIYIEIYERNKCLCSFYCVLLTLHVSAPIGGHLQVVFVIQKYFKVVTVYVNGSVASVCIKANAVVT